MPKYLFIETDPQNRKIRLTEACYRYHILEEHPELDDVDSIANTVRSPDIISSDARNVHRLVYYRLYQSQPQRWFKVVVEQDEIVTAYRVGRLKKGEAILWQT